MGYRFTPVALCCLCRLYVDCRMENKQLSSDICEVSFVNFILHFSTSIPFFPAGAMLVTYGCV
jgi:hypothetical protein